MANTLYDAAREAFLTGQINWLEDTIKVMLVRSAGYNCEPATHVNLSDIPTSARATAGVTLTNKTANGGATKIELPEKTKKVYNKFSDMR